jgi:hypothetical protein
VSVYVDARSRPLNALADMSARDLAGTGRFSGVRRNWPTSTLHTLFALL